MANKIKYKAVFFQKIYQKSVSLDQRTLIVFQSNLCRYDTSTILVGLFGFGDVKGASFSSREPERFATIQNRTEKFRQRQVSSIKNLNPSPTRESCTLNTAALDYAISFLDTNTNQIIIFRNFFLRLLLL